MTENKQGIGPMSYAQAQLRNRLPSGKAGDVITAEELERLTGKRWKELLGALRLSRHWTAKNHGLVWVVQRGARCIKCIDSSEKIVVADSDRQSVSRKMKRSMVVLATVKTDELPETDVPKYNALVAQTGALIQASSTGMRKAIEARGSGVSLPALLENMMQSKNGK